MKFARIGAPNAETPVLLDAGKAFDLSGLTTDIDGAFWSKLDAVKAAHAAGELSEVSLEGQRIGAPIARPQAVICIGMNYAAHAAESGSEPPTEPVIFFKHPNTVCGPDDDVPLPAHATKMDWEVELALIVGKRTWLAQSREEALQSLAAVTLADDLSERTWQLEISGGQWSKGKASPGSTPLGPIAVTVDEVDLAALTLRSFVNGEPRQHSNTADLIFDPATIIYELSQFMQLEPGDLILTGTPEGVALSGRFPYLVDGDKVTVEISGLGQQNHVMRAVTTASQN